MKKYLVICLLLLTHAANATTTTSDALRSSARVIKWGKLTPTPITIVGSVALAYILIELADALEVDKTPQTLSPIPHTPYTHYNELNYYANKATQEESENDQTEAQSTEAYSDEFELEKPLVVIIHGFFSSPNVHNGSISPLTRELTQRGFKVYRAKVSKFEFAPNQAMLLHAEIQKFHPEARRVILIGHSLGGIIARQYATDYQAYWGHGNITNVISIGSPHQGIFKEDHIAYDQITMTLKTLGHGLKSKAAAAALETIDYLDKDYMRDTFNSQVKEVPGTDYLSTMTIRRNTFGKKRSEKVKNTTYLRVNNPKDRHVSDGLVKVHSSMYSKMLYADKCVHPVGANRLIKGPLYEADHLDQVTTLKSLVKLKNNAYRLSRDIADYIQHYLTKGKYTNPIHCPIY